MTKRCKEDFERLELEQIDESDFTDSELEVSGRLFGWKKEIDDQVRKAIHKEKWGLEDNLSKSKLNRPTFYPPLVIRSKSGYGKSILFGKILAELIDAKYSTEQVWLASLQSYCLFSTQGSSSDNFGRSNLPRNGWFS